MSSSLEVVPVVVFVLAVAAPDLEEGWPLRKGLMDDMSTMEAFLLEDDEVLLLLLLLLLLVVLLDGVAAAPSRRPINRDCRPLRGVDDAMLLLLADAHDYLCTE